MVHNSRERTDALEQARAQHEELVRHLARIEQMLSTARDRDITLDVGQTHMATGAAPASHGNTNLSPGPSEAPDFRLQSLPLAGSSERAAGSSEASISGRDGRAASPGPATEA